MNFHINDRSKSRGGMQLKPVTIECIRIGW